jgi:hypothetical protein
LGINITIETIIGNNYAGANLIIRLGADVPGVEGHWIKEVTNTIWSYGKNKSNSGKTKNISWDNAGYSMSRGPVAYSSSWGPVGIGGGFSFWGYTDNGAMVISQNDPGSYDS